MIESENTIETLKNQLENMFSKKQIKSFLMKVNQSFQNHTIPLSDLYDVIGKIFRKNPDFFMEKLYRNIHMYAKIFNPASQIYELERGLLEKYSLFEEESIIKGFNGIISVKNAYINGYISLTNKRIILQGILKIMSRTKRKLRSYTGSRSFKPKMSGFTPIGANPMIKSKIIRYSQLKSYDKRGSYSSNFKNYFIPFSHKTKQNYLPLTPCFGYQIPYFHANNIIKKKNSIKYTIKYEIKHKNTLELFPISFKISPLPPENKKYKSFKQESAEILTLLEQKIKKHAIR